MTDPTLDLGRVAAIVVEVHYSREDFEFKAIIRALKNHGFHVYMINPIEYRFHLLATRSPIF
ncbi:MAG: hypothetical protein NZ941_03165 [Candidatus Caldarchaeum sp.]|nr:hypothetical protein [Candidatus Caldarchaeum sp.]